MSKYFNAVEEKILESDFFIEKMKNCRPFSSQDDVKYYFSAFLSSTRNITFTMQYSMSKIPKFSEWYEKIQEQMRNNELAVFFKEARNDNIKQGFNHINITMHQKNEPLKIFFTNNGKYKYAPEDDLITACEQYFKVILLIITECIEVFGEYIDVEKYFSEDAVKRRGQTTWEEIFEIWGYPKMGLKSDDEIIAYLMARKKPTRLEIVLRKYLDTKD